MKYFIDTHDKSNGTFPPDITPSELKSFYEQYEAACQQEGVVSVKIHAGLEDGKAFCLNIAPSAEAIKRVHDRVGLPYDSITQIKTISPVDILLD
jgi:hypothetical protein